MVNYKILGPGIQPASLTPVQTELRIQGSDEVLVLPVITSTKVIEIKELLAYKLGVETGDMKIVTKMGCSYRTQQDHEEVRRKVTVHGIKSFHPQPTLYTDPFLIIGAGHIGLRHGLYLLQRDFSNFVIVDRRNKVGGTSWISQANKTSKLQTELGTYHLQYDEMNPVPKLTTWPTRDELLHHFAQVTEEYGLMPHIRLNTNVKSLDFSGKTSADGPLTASLEATDEHYQGVAPPEPTGQGIETLRVASASMYPGNLSLPRQEEYRGEDQFGGDIMYAMFDNVKYDEVVSGKDVMIAGHGAFGVENVRTCCEYSVKKIYLVCRRKNLACPRVASWFANQSDPPIPGPTFVKCMEPAYELIGFDPWSYYSMQVNSTRTALTIHQKSRFGIGDVYFLAISMGKLEVVVDQVKRLSKQRIHLESGRQLEVQAILKVFGFTGDWEVDRLMKVKSMTGLWADTDNRRYIASEFPGVFANNFASTSLSPAAISWVESAVHVMRFPKDWNRVLDSQMMPVNKPDPSIDKPGYVLEARAGMTVGFVLLAVCPRLGESGLKQAAMKKQKQLECHPLERFIEECANEWAEYGRIWKSEDPSLKDAPPYPYTVQFVRDLLEEADRLNAEKAASQPTMSSYLSQP